MRENYRLIFALITLALIQACIAHDFRSTDIEEPAEGQGIATEATVTVDPFNSSDGTKWNLNHEGDSWVGTWTLNDRLGFWPQSCDVNFGDPQQAPFHVSSVNGSAATFIADGWGLLCPSTADAKGKKYYSYFPYDATAVYNRVALDYRNQTQISNGSTSHLGAYDYLYSYALTKYTGPINLTYHHIGAIVHLKLTIPQDFRGDVFKDMILTSAQPVLVSQAQYNPSSDSPAATSPVMTDTFSVSLEGAGGISCSDSGLLDIYCMMCPGSVASGKTITVNLTALNGDLLTGTFSADTHQPAKIYHYSATMAYSGSATEDLSRVEPANSYVISAAGRYKFRATKGNSGVYVQPASVKVLWETANTLEAPSSGTLVSSASYSNGYIYFTTPDTFTEGNALIAAYSGANCTGDILWSWHIWCTDKPADEKYRNGAGYLMDRNLGALSTTGNLATGLFYQWGRKDPFMGHVSPAKNAGVMALQGAASKNVASSSSTGTEGYARAHPTEFITASFGNGSSNGDWIWTNPAGNVGSAMLWYRPSHQKSDSDPCPPGYKVAYGGYDSDHKGFWGTAMNSVAINYSIGLGTDFVIDGVSYPNRYGTGLYFPLFSGAQSLYPSAGYISENGNRNSDGTHVDLWLDFPSGVDNSLIWQFKYSGYFNVNLVDDNKKQQYLYADFNSGRACGRSVRCQREGKVVDVSSAADNEGYGPSPVPSSW